MPGPTQAQIAQWLCEGDHMYRISESGILQEVPIHAELSDCRNHLAIIAPGNRPGHLHRTFMELTSGTLLVAKYRVRGHIQAGDALEFAADSYDNEGRRWKKRSYHVVRQITERYMLLRRCDSADDAMRMRVCRVCGEILGIRAADGTTLARKSCEGGKDS